MNGSADVAWLTIHLRQPNPGDLNATLSGIVKRAHACGLRAATISHAADDVPLPRQPEPTISLPDGVGGTVTIADDPDRLRTFVATLGDLVAPGASIRLDIAGTIHELNRLPVES